MSKQDLPAMVTQKIIPFLQSLGISVCIEPIGKTTFLPGLHIRNGQIVIDPEQLSYPGDLLHEAGHIAVTAAALRPQLNDDLAGEFSDGGNEMAAIAWSYAAAKHLEINPAEVFHQHGYKDGSEAILTNFANGYYIGVPLLQWYGMAYENHQATEAGALPYPHMVNWLSQK